MRRTPLVALLCLVFPPAAFAGQADERPPLKAGLAACASGAAQDERFAVFTGSMPASAGTRRMAMRFALQTRPQGMRRWVTIKNRRFSRWERSDAGREAFFFTKRVERLSQAAEYRAVVRFRWYQGGGGKIDKVRRTPICVQPDQRPNLQVEGVEVLPAPDAASRRYVVTVLNAGLTVAGRFEVGLASPARDDVRAVPGLPAGERTRVEFTGPACAASETLTAHVDVRGAVDESDEGDNRLIMPCGPR